jgi:hypothetical protein
VISETRVATYDVKGRGKGDSTLEVADEVARYAAGRSPATAPAPGRSGSRGKKPRAASKRTLRKKRGTAKHAKRAKKAKSRR